MSGNSALQENSRNWRIDEQDISGFYTHAGFWSDVDAFKKIRFSSFMGTLRLGHDESVHSVSVGDELRCYEEQIAEHYAEADREIEQLRSRYTIEGFPEVRDFLKAHRLLPALLHEIAPNLKLHFGPYTVAHLEAVSAGDESPILRILVPWDKTVEEADLALASFDERYWLLNHSRALGNVVIRYELR